MVQVFPLYLISNYQLTCLENSLIFNHWFSQVFIISSIRLLLHFAFRLKEFFITRSDKYMCMCSSQGLPRWLSGKESACQCRRHGFDPWPRNIPWKRKWQLTPQSLPGESHGQRSLVGLQYLGLQELEQLSSHAPTNNRKYFSLVIVLHFGCGTGSVSGLRRV